MIAGALTDQERLELLTPHIARMLYETVHGVNGEFERLPTKDQFWWICLAQSAQRAACKKGWAHVGVMQ